jgi:hypothetical protein
MKKLLLLSLLAFQFTAAKAQSWVYHPFPSGSDSAIWIQQHADFQGTTYFWRTYLYGDTTISSLSYKKLYRTSVNSYIYPPPPPPPFYNSYNFIGALRQDIPAKRVYFYEEETGTEKLLYDFTLAIGDTAYSDIPWADSIVVQYVVTGIDSILAGSVYHKRLVIESLPTTTLASVAANWIEGIGSEAGPLNRYLTGFEFSHALACFSFNEENKYYDEMWPPAPDCSFSVAIGEQENDLIGIVVSPNPTAGIISLSVSCNETLSLELMDLSGKILFSCQTRELSGITVDLNEFAKGIYLVKLADTKGNSVSKKIVKE